jgi:hypothetical protein
MENLIGVRPEEVLVHGPKKILISDVHWHVPETGIIVSYTPTARDVEDHFGVFRGVDQIESFAQATVVSCYGFLEAVKHKCHLTDIRDNFVPLFLGLGQVIFKNYLLEGETFINIGKITFFKFRQITCEGRIYKVPKNLDLDAYFSNYTTEQFLNYELSEDFTLIAELFDVTGRGIKREKFIQNSYK